MTKTLTAWSYSRWDRHHDCPLRFKLEFLDGRAGPEGPAIINGQVVHKIAANYLLGPVDAPVPEELGKQKALAQQIRTQFDNVVVEQQWGFNRQWKATGWFGNDTWLRSVLDVGVLYEDNSVEVIDWKTGKPRGTHEEQMELFAATVMVKYPFVVHVDTRLAYIDFDKSEFGGPNEGGYERSDLPAMIDRWENRVRPMFEDTSYLPRPGDYCKFCPFSRSATNGQDCRYG